MFNMYHSLMPYKLKRQVKEFGFKRKWLDIYELSTVIIDWPKWFLSICALYERHQILQWNR